MLVICRDRACPDEEEDSHPHKRDFASKKEVLNESYKNPECHKKSFFCPSE